MSRRQGITVLIKGLGIGGAERLISEAASYWDRERFDYRVAYLLPWKDQLVAELESKDVPVAMLGSKRGAGPISLLRFRRFISESRTDLVHAHLPSAGIIARVASPVPVVYTEHNLVGSYRLPTRLLNRLTYGRNARLMAVSGAVAESIAGYPGPSALVIPNGVSVASTPEAAAAARAELGLGPDDDLVVHVGNIRPHKGHSTLVAAAAWLGKNRSGTTVVSIGGEKAPGDLERVRALARDLGSDGVIRFLGRREDALAFMAAADVVVNPSDVEGLPVALLEALALERPVVATAVGGVPALIEHEQTGLLVAPGDPEGLAAAVDRLLSDGALARRLAAAGNASVLRNHGIEQMVRDIENVYAEVLRV
jgi:glycosyltransferase involved in cell wall biosynthesis